MGLLADAFRTLALFGGETKQAVATAIPTWQVGLPATPIWNQRSYDQLARKGYLGSEVVFAACQAVAKSAALPRMVVFDSKAHDADAIFDHPALDVLNRPNKWWTTFMLWSSTVVALKINGNAYWEIVRGRSGKIIEYWPLRPDRVWIIPDEKDYIQAYEYRIGERVFTLDPDDVIHFKNPNPLNDYYGLSPLAVLAERIDIDVWCREFTTAFFRNAGVPSGLLNIMRSVEPNEREIIRQRFRQQYGGPDGWGNVLVIDNGQATYTKMGMDPVGLGLDDINRVTESKICAVLDVPPSIIWTVLGHQSSSGLNNSNKESDRAQWWTGSLAPMYEDLAQQFSLQIKPDFPEVDHFDFDLSQVPGYTEDVDKVHARVRADFTAGLIPWHVAAQTLGYPTDQPGWVLLPANMIPTPSDELANYHKGDKPPGQPDQPPGLPPGGGGAFGGRPGGGGAPPSIPGVPPPGGAQESGSAGPGGKMIETKMTSDGRFEIIPDCPEDDMGHYRSVELGVCAWCGQDPYMLKTDATSGYDYSSTQLNLPEILGNELVEWAEDHIDPDDLGSGGIEMEPHVTVKYGLMPNVGASDVARVVKDQTPVAMTFGPNYVFAGQDQGGGVPLYVSVTSDDAGHLNGIIKRSLANVETHTNYTPHVTIAYIKHSAVSKYVGQRSPLYGMHITLGDLTYSGTDGRQVAIPLNATKILTEGIDTYGGIMVPPGGPRQPPKKKKTAEVVELLNHWRDTFAAGGGDFDAAMKALDDHLEVTAWLYKHATGEWPTKVADDGERLSYKAGNLEALLDYWKDRFDGGHPGDFDDCVDTLTDKVDNPQALCAWLHHEATGYWPGHAPSEESDKNGKLNLNGWEHTIVDSRDELTKAVTEQIRDMERSLLGAGQPVQVFRPKTQTWLNILDLPETKDQDFEDKHPRDNSGRFAAGVGGGENVESGDSSSLITKDNPHGFLRDKGDTQKLYMPEGGKKGDYVQARLDKVHEPAIDRAQHGIYENHEQGVAGGGYVPPAEGGPTVSVLGGGGASGKSTALQRSPEQFAVPDKDHAVWSNADWNKTEDIPETQAMRDAGSVKWAMKVHEESSDIAGKVVKTALQNGRNAVVDAVMNSSMTKLQTKIQGYRDDGAREVNANYLTVPIPQAIAAAKGRTDRPVDEAIIEAAHTSVNSMLPRILNGEAGYDSVKIWDNTWAPKGSPQRAAKLIAERTKQGQVIIHDRTAWENAQKRSDRQYTG